MKSAAAARCAALVAVISAASVFGNAAPERAVAQGFQPHLRLALTDLNRAAYQLSVVSPDKNGHRARALALTAQATAEVRAAMAAGMR